MGTISVCMIAKDEEGYIENALASIADIADEIVLVDTGSSDKTKEIAAELGAKVVDFKWQDDFSIARNESLKHATKDWILIIDADEAIASRDIEKLKSLAKDKEAMAYILTQQSYTNDSKLKDWTPVKRSSKESMGFSGWVPAKIIRMFRNDKRIRFSGEVHETVKPSIDKIKGKIVECNIPIHHYGMGRKSKAEGKAALYTKLGKQKAKAGDARALYELGKQLVQSKKYEEAIESFTSAIRKKPDYAEVYADLGTLFMKMGKTELAKENLKKAINLDTKSYDAFNNLGAIYGMQDRHKDAMLLFMKAIELKPDYASAYKNLGLSLDKLGRKDEAALCFAAAIKLNPKYKDEIVFK